MKKTKTPQKPDKKLLSPSEQKFHQNESDLFYEIAWRMLFVHKDYPENMNEEQQETVLRESQNMLKEWGKQTISQILQIIYNLGSPYIYKSEYDRGFNVSKKMIINKIKQLEKENDE